MLRNILGPIFNLYLDQFLTYKICYFVFFWGGGAETPICIVLSAKHAKNEETQKKDTICEHNCANCSCQNVRFFFCIFHFCCFCNFHFFSEMFLTDFQKSKHNKIGKQEEQKNNNNKKTRCKAKINPTWWLKTKKTTSRKTKKTITK